MNSTSHGELADAVRLARAARRWTVRELAERAGIAVQTVTRLEKGEPVRAGSWRGLARAFDVDENALLQATASPDSGEQVTRILKAQRLEAGPASIPISIRRRSFDEALRHILALPADAPDGDVLAELSLWKFLRNHEGKS